MKFIRQCMVLGLAISVCQGRANDTDRLRELFELRKRLVALSIGLEKKLEQNERIIQKLRKQIEEEREKNNEEN